MREFKIHKFNRIHILFHNFSRLYKKKLGKWIPTYIYILFVVPYANYLWEVIVCYIESYPSPQVDILKSKLYLVMEIVGFG